MALKARIKKNWRDAIREMYIRWRFKGSGFRWFWLAKIMSGRSQHESTKRGVDTRSVPMYVLRWVQLSSEQLFSHIKLVAAMIKLYASVKGHSHLVGLNQADGIRAKVGIRIFSI